MPSDPYHYPASMISARLDDPDLVVVTEMNVGTLIVDDHREVRMVITVMSGRENHADERVVPRTISFALKPEQARHYARLLEAAADAEPDDSHTIFLPGVDDP